MGFLDRPAIFSSDDGKRSGSSLTIAKAYISTTKGSPVSKLSAFKLILAIRKNDHTPYKSPTLLARSHRDNEKPNR